LLFWLGQILTPLYGPFRLFNSYLFLAGLGAALGAISTVFLLPKFWKWLPTDNGRIHAVDGHKAKGKPVSAGAVFISLLVIVSLLVVPFNWRVLGILACMMLAMLEGHLDDMHKNGGLSEYLLGAVDLGISFIAALILSGFEDQVIWLPLIKTPVTLSIWIYLPLATVILWLMINATNCTDGVDGLSGSLSILAFIYLGGILYAIIGHRDISRYLLVPHYVDGADWALIAFTMVGCLAGYLWHNSLPSAVLMGDAGSRPLGLLLGILVMAAGNPFLIFVVTGVVILNGATGLLKVALLRFFKISIFKSIRYPLHDHARHHLKWSNTQVLVRFVLLQAVGTPLLLVLLFKVR
jgi:phospho-N-acetylmuramoyl-pentapeptide-transferase